jgi:hypothetical protein
MEWGGNVLEGKETLRDGTKNIDSVCKPIKLFCTNDPLTRGVLRHQSQHSTRAARIKSLVIVRRVR